MHRKNKQHNLHRWAVCRKCRPPIFIPILRRYDDERNRKTVIAGKAPLGGSAGQRSGKGTQDPDTAANPGRCDFGESITADNPNDIGTVGGIFMGSIQSSTMILCALGNRSASFLSRRAHLLTTPMGRWYFRWKPCALRGGCGFCGSLMDNATFLRICCHCPRSWCAVNAHRIPSLHRRYSTNCPHKPATAQGTPFGRGSFVCGYDPKFSLGSFSL